MDDDSAPRFGEADHTTCDREPIHVPGSIQPHGALLVLQEPGLELVQISENLWSCLGREVRQAPFGRLDDLIGTQRAAAFRDRCLGLASFDDVNPLPLSIADAAGTVRSFDGVLHRSGGLLVLELEPAPPRAPDALESIVRSARRAAQDLRLAGSVGDLLQAAAGRVRELSGFDRVMVYRFDRDWHGEVVAESLRDDLEPFLGLHFPASDIPQQARALYSRNWLRCISDVDYTPVRLTPVDNPVTGAPLDLSFSSLRSVSPVHLEYLRNMGVAASLSISLLQEGRLWGLIACHHQTPRHLPFEVRAVCEVLGQVFSWHLSTRIEVADSRQRVESEQLRERLIAAMSVDGAPGAGLLASEEAFLSFGRASGGAVLREGALRMVGATPSEEEIRALVERLATGEADDVLATDCLARLHPPAEKYKDVASGLLAVVLSRQHRDYALWFRPELLRTVKWGGDPSKPVVLEDRGQRISPRKSFAAWSDVVRLHSVAWEEVEVEAARHLRTAALSVLVRRAAELERLNQELAESIRARDDFLSVASHELRTPISTLQLQLHMLLATRPGGGPATPEPLRAKLELANRQVLRLAQIVDSLLDVTRVRAERLDLRLEEGVDLAAITRDAFARMHLDQERSGSRLDLRTAEEVRGRWDPLRVDQIVTNLASNAFKYGAGRPVSVAVTREGDSGRFEIRDEGIGMSAADQARVFKRFERAVAEYDFSGLGLGLWITQQLVTRLGGEISLASQLGRGTTFIVLLPLRGPSQ